MSVVNVLLLSFLVPTLSSVLVMILAFRGAALSNACLSVSPYSLSIKMQQMSVSTLGQDGAKVVKIENPLAPSFSQGRVAPFKLLKLYRILPAVGGQIRGLGDGFGSDMDWLWQFLYRKIWTLEDSIHFIYHMDIKSQTTKQVPNLNPTRLN